MNVAEPLVRVRSEVKLATPEEFVDFVALPLTTPLQVPVTLAPEMGFPLASNAVTSARARQRYDPDVDMVMDRYAVGIAGFSFTVISTVSEAVRPPLSVTVSSTV